MKKPKWLSFPKPPPIIASKALKSGVIPACAGMTRLFLVAILQIMKALRACSRSIEGEEDRLP
ncbi:hypothetical protein [Propionivibrio sp.]|uniref:hypothetical protein n=1 Tax=Propionivibrio sp. TaxID=2212460 RepID=UPI0026298896|nr:hypothetical protein [Propionivibrio sp.]